MKPIRFAQHALAQCKERGAAQYEDRPYLTNSHLLFPAGARPSLMLQHK